MKTTQCWALSLLLPVYAAGADSTIDPGHRYAYGANVGWVDMRADGTNGAVIGQFVCSGYLYGAAMGWVSVGSGSPTNGYRYTNSGNDDFGVNHDGHGNLRGDAWGANVGWLVFEDTGAPGVDLLTGNLSGYVWGANVGWIALSNLQAYARTTTLNSGPDSNGNGIPDQWEMERVGSLALLTAAGHYGGKTVTDWEEYVADTDPNDPNDYLRVAQFTATNGSDAAVTWLSKPTRFYRIERNDDLTNSAAWTDNGLGNLTPDPLPASTTTRVVTDATATQRFYRVRAVVPLAP